MTLKLCKCKTVFKLFINVIWDTENLIILTPKTVCKYFFIPHFSNNTRLQDFREQLAKWSWKVCICWKIKWEFSSVEYCWVAISTAFGVVWTFIFVKGLWKVNSVVPTLFLQLFLHSLVYDIVQQKSSLIVIAIVIVIAPYYIILYYVILYYIILYYIILYYIT